jgi:hypothetical protein
MDNCYPLSLEYPPSCRQELIALLTASVVWLGNELGQKSSVKQGCSAKLEAFTDKISHSNHFAANVFYNPTTKQIVFLAVYLLFSISASTAT